jgi:hypothetical protein
MEHDAVDDWSEIAHMLMLMYRWGFLFLTILLASFLE